MSKLSPFQIAACAHAAHESNRAWSRSLGDHTHKAWDDLDSDQQHQAKASVIGIAENDENAEASHKRWVDYMRVSGWTLGPEKNTKTKTHPCLVPWNELPLEQRFKDEMWVTIVKLMASAFWKQPE